MNRRDFIKTAASAGLASVILPGCFSQSGSPVLPDQSQKNSHQGSQRPEVASPARSRLAIAEGTDPETLIEKGLGAMGGIGQFVKAGNIVVIKPNFSNTRGPEAAVTTNPILVGALVRQCVQAGAKEVRVIDHTFYSGEMCLEASGIRTAVAGAGGRAYTINSRNDYNAVNINGEILKQADYSKDVLEADVFINMPILKQCDATEISAGLKNLMGVVWDRGFFHRTDLHQTIAELAAYKKPTLTILDAIKGIIANGPSGPGPIKEWKQVVLGTDMLAVDAYGAGLLNFKPADVRHLAIAAKLRVGNPDWQSLEIVRV
ncbi:twin-arginine translocation pathway signal sequence bacterial/archaeal [Lucifera butyrica]|uniref:Twin-arginine translocation pathway signal sequence bacterial/archaeal n=1 Tax=Lucifera butyrica TaxID=1351585 RepID=A0A498R3V3_9FIRM|nr:DUF362 domain-containing protein [Lucifera butyrica]VBB04952.1 twin-arginine translocation pathway signal sequence bacterial/archaeal [Lucifera butyrica]